MGVHVSGTTVSVTIENADSISWTSHLLFTVDNTYDIGASGATRPRTGYFGTSVVSPLVTNAGTLALSATGANVITLSTNGSERARVTSGGNVLVGTTTDDASNKLQVAGNVAVTGSVMAGVLGSTGQVKIANSGGANTGYVAFHKQNGTRLGYMGGDSGNFLNLTLENSAFYSITGGNVLVGTTTDGNYKLDVAASGSSGTLRVYDQTATTGSTSLVVRAGAGQSTNAVLNVTANDGTTSVLKVLETKIGFFNATPVVKQTVTADSASILAALQAYGLAV